MPRVTKYDENDEPISGYRLVGFLGAGQFGEVWKAVEPATGKLVAIKIIDLSHSNSALKELKALNLVKNLNHPNLIPIFTARLKDKNNREIPLHKTEELKGKGVLRELVIAMGLGDKSLSARLKELNPDGTDPQDFRGLPVDELLGYMQGAAKGIDFLNKADHGLGTADGPIVHCDIKPDNMMIVAGEVQIVDCGVAVIITPDVRQTKAAGSPAYSAPELTGNKPVPGTDQYALAISYYELRTGTLPFDDQMGQLSIMLAHAEGRLDFTSTVITDEERKVLKWATAVRPKERYLSCTDMVKQLERAVEGLTPLEPGKVLQRSGVVPTSKSRVAPPPPPLDPSMLRSTPNLPSPTATPSRPSADPAVSFDLPDARDDLRGTIIPGSDRLLPPSDSGLTLPARPGDVAAFGSSQSEIDMPVGRDDFPTDDDFSETGTHTGLPRMDARGPADPATRSTDVSRPQISVDGNDPMGARAGSVELDPEIAKIIKGSGGAKPAAMRLPSSPSVQTQRPQSRAEMAPTTPGKRATEYPRDTPDDDEAKSLPPWAKEAKAAEQQASRASIPSIPTTNWKEPDTAKAGGGMGAKILIGGVLAAGVAGVAGAYFSGLIGGNGSSASVSSGGAPIPKPPVTIPKPPDPKQQPEPEKVDPELLKAIDDLIAMKAGTDFVAALAKYDMAQAKIDGLPKSAIYEEARTSRKNRLTEFRAEIDAAITVRADDIDRLIKSADPKDPTASEKTFLEAERLIGQLPRVLPTGLMDKRTAWSNDIGKQRVAMAGSEDERKFLAALLGLETLPVATLTTQAKDIYTVNLDLNRRKKIGAKLVAIGEQKTEYRDVIIQFLVEDRGRFDLLLPTDADKQPIFKWRTVPVKALSDSLRTKLAALTTGKTAKAVADDINAAIAELKDRKKTAGTPFGTLWDDKLLDPEIDKTYKLATLWSDADRGFDISGLRKHVQQAAAPDLALPMALEYMRISVNKSEPIADLRSVRNYSRNWTVIAAADRQRLDEFYQLALARQVRKDLAPSTGKPNWADIAKLCDKDDALGWRAAAEAEGRLDAKNPLGNLTDADSANKDDDTANDRKAYVAYLKAIAKTDKTSIEELQKLFQAKPLSMILSTSFRRSFGARAMADAAIAKVEFKEKVEDLLTGRWNPYSNDSKALGFLATAYELDGAANPDWAIHLHFLADASGDPTTAQMAAGKVGSELLTKANGSLALAFLVKRATNRSATPASRIADRAAATRLARSLHEAETPMDAEKWQKEFREGIATFAKTGLVESGGSNADRRTLEFAVFRQDFHGNTKYDKAWIDKAREQIGPIANDLPAKDPLRADALAYRAFITLNRFHYSRPFGDLKKEAVSESVREREWNDMILDAENALAIEKDNPVAAQVLSYAYYGMFAQPTSYIPPESLVKKYSFDDRRDKDTVLKVAGYLKDATQSPRAAKISEPSTLLAYLRVRSQFLFAAGNAFAKRGEATQNVRDILLNADKSAEQTIKLRSEKQVADHTFYGRVLEDLAWIGQESPAENYRKSIEMYRTGTGLAASTAVLREEVVRGHMDMARATVRAVQFGYFPQAKLADAADAWTAMDAAIEAMPEAERGKTAQIQAEAAYWKAMRKLVAGRNAEAAAAFAAASENLRVNDPNHYVPALVHRSEAILAGSDGREAIAEILRAVETAGGIVFAVDYINARKAVADNDLETAKGHFAGAFRTIQNAWRQRELKMDDPFALRCLAHELKAVKNLTAQERTGRKDLLKELQTAFAWTLTTADKDFIAEALK